MNYMKELMLQILQTESELRSEFLQVSLWLTRLVSQTKLPRQQTQTRSFHAFRNHLVAKLQDNLSWINENLYNI